MEESAFFNADFVSAELARIREGAAEERALDPRDKGRVDEALKDWIQGGRVDSRGLARRLPHTAEGLQDGTVDPEALARELEFLYYDSKPEAAGPLVVVIQELASNAIPNPDNFTNESPQNAEARRNQLCGEFTERLLSTLPETFHEGNFELELAELREKAVVRVFYKSYRETCIAFSDRIDREAFQGRRGECRQHLSKLIDKRSKFEEYFKSIVDGIDTPQAKKDREILLRKKRLLIHAARGIAEGKHKVGKSCWECGAGESEHHCSSCQVAVYCSRTCQKAAWKQGHQIKCAKLKSKKEAHEDALHVIDTFHENSSGSVNGGTHPIHLSDEYDYQIASTMLNLEDQFAQVPGPSMTFFYENLGRVARGEWWILPESTTTRGAYNDRLDTTQGREMESVYMNCLATMLACDFFGHVQSMYRAGGLASSSDEAAIVTAFSSHYANHVIDLLGGVMMPAGRFLELYESKPKSQNNTDRSRLRRQIRTDFLSLLRDEHHK